MKILVACEESQEVTKRFREKGHESYSCDIQECSGGYPEWHIKDDVKKILNDSWDMIIAFPPCTHLAVSGAAHFKKKKEDGRQKEGIDFFMLFTDLECPKVAIENPIGIMSKLYRKPDQIIRPFEYGENSTKSTCLWLKGLPLLQPTNIIKTTKHTTKTGKVYDEWWFKTCLISDLSERAKIRSKTFPGIADAIAEQWSNINNLQGILF